MRTLQFVGSFRRSTRWFSCGALLLVIALTCTSCASSSVSLLAPSSSVSLQSPHHLNASAWEQLAIPAASADMRGVEVAPADPATIFACSAQPMALWRTTDAGSHWARYAISLDLQDQCYFSIAPDDPQRVTFQVSRLGDDAQPCAHDSFYLSDDGGAYWRPLPSHASIAPANVSFGSCDLHVTQKHLYLAYSFEVSAQAPQVSLLERSDDNGATWVRADHGLGDDALFFMPEVGSGETLAVSVTHFPAQAPTTPIATNLWTSVDAGQTWRQTSALPDGVGPFLWSSWPKHGNRWPTPDHPFYALEHEQLPSDLYRERVLMSGDGHGWTLLPPLPVSGASAERPGVLQTLSALPDGRLAVWGPDPQGGIPTSDSSTTLGQFSAFWVWFWDPTTQHWQVLPSQLKTPARESCGLCWQGSSVVGRDGAAYLYVSRLNASLTGETPPGMFRIQLAPGA